MIIFVFFQKDHLQQIFRPEVAGVTTPVELLSSPWALSAGSGAAEKYQNVDKNILNGMDTLTLTFNLHGLCAYEGDASAIIFDQPINQNWHYISLSSYGKNCYDGVQSVDIPLSDFPGLDLTKDVGTFHIRFWSGNSYRVDVTSAVAKNRSAIIPTSTPTPPPEQSTTNLLNQPWHLATSSGASEAYQLLDKNILKGAVKLVLTYDLHGLCALDGDASAIIFDQNGWRYTSLAKYGTNCKDGPQTVIIPLSDFSGLDINQPLTGSFHARFWSGKAFAVDITEAELSVTGVVPTNTPTPTPIIIPSPTKVAIPTPTSTSSPTVTSSPVGKTWDIQSIDAMKYTKDDICDPKDRAWIEKWVDKAVELGATHVALSMPYDNPSCGDAVAYSKLWISVIRSKGLKVWHRQMPLAFEGIYSTVKDANKDYLAQIVQYIKTNATDYQEGDVFAPIPEPQNGGIQGVSYCAQNTCIFPSVAAFNQWIRDAMDQSETALASIGLKGKVKVGYFGFDGFIADGLNNPDWQGKGFLEDSTVARMGEVTVDHYPEAIGTTMAGDLQLMATRFPGVPIIIGEWGTITGGDTEQQVKNSMGAAANNKAVVGFNYWHLGPGGNEALIDDNFNNLAQFDDVHSYYK